MYTAEIKDFNLQMIMDSGQAFRISRADDRSFMVISGGHYVTIEPSPEDACTFTFSCNEGEFRAIWYDYFDLATDYGTIKRSIDPVDRYLTTAIRYGEGIRVLRQDLWETIISFLISQNNNISRIRNSIAALCLKYGEAVTDSAYSFPLPAALSQAGSEGLQGLGLGYRDKYILAMADKCSSPDGQRWLTELAQADYHTAFSLLTAELGIGKKVADCICLFSLHHVDAFPVDTHVRQILEVHYPEGFPFAKYDGYAGILQQYMFYYKLSLPSVYKARPIHTIQT